MLKEYRKKIFIIALLLFLIVSLSAVSADDSVSNDTAQSNNAVTETVADISTVDSHVDDIPEEVSIDDASITETVPATESNENIIENDNSIFFRK